MNSLYSNQIFSTINVQYNAAYEKYKKSLEKKTNADIYYTNLTAPQIIVNPYKTINVMCNTTYSPFSKFCSKKCNEITKKHDNVSKKMLQSKMIKNRTSIKYSNSYTDNINEIILSTNVENNKNLLLQLSYSVYIRYFEQLKIKNNCLPILLNNVLAKLTLNEYINVFCIKTHVEIFPPIILDKTYYIVTRNINNFKFFQVINLIILSG